MKYETKVIESIEKYLDWEILKIDNAGFQYGKSIMEFQKTDGSKYVITVTKIKDKFLK